MYENEVDPSSEVMLGYFIWKVGNLISISIFQLLPLIALPLGSVNKLT